MCVSASEAVSIAWLMLIGLLCASASVASAANRTVVNPNAVVNLLRERSERGELEVVK